MKQLLPWAAHHQINLVITYTYLTDDGITVDWFVPETGLSNLDDRVGEPMPFDETDRPAMATTARLHMDDMAMRPQFPDSPTNVIDDTSHYGEIDDNPGPFQERTSDFETECIRQMHRSL